MSTKDRLAKLLATALSESVNAEMLHPVAGFWKRQDVYRWESSSIGHYTVSSWCTMTDCVRHGIRVKIDGHNVEVWCRKCSTSDE